MQDWAKFHTDLLDNPDVALMSAGEYQIFTFLLLLCRREGITDGRMVGWDDKRLAYRLRKTPEEIHAAVTRLSREDIHWLEVDEEGVIWIVNYALRQYGKPSAAPEAAKVRKQNQRKRVKQAEYEESEENTPPEQVASRESHAAVTPPEEKREEEKRVEEKRVTAREKPARPARTPKPAAVLEYHEICKAWPNSSQERAIEKNVTDLVKWHDVLTEWRMRGYSPVNAQGPLDWYQKGIPPPGKNGNPAGNEPAGFPAMREYLERKAKGEFQ